ncbi:uncharacterized protein BXZ73DRAFT_101336 [Epithele typhae]|uniref:uncharacterized protein n=1 Tax=Epithele typhae TaxID=378194 RepID=UPI002008E502|nr:uncharacterized protein BXZ73DRAFT_101336 [Epithele typhae]KAH9932802.1 hypothetical protein BXZ73DRAFT_101336 [Epithele typhae]
MPSRRIQLFFCAAALFLISLWTYPAILRSFSTLRSFTLTTLNPRPSVDPRETLNVFDHIYVISRSVRNDRRTTMEQLRSALGLRWAYVDATEFTDPSIARKAQCVRDVRAHALQATIDWPSVEDLEAWDDNLSRLRGPPPPGSPEPFCPPWETPSSDPSAQQTPLTCAERDSALGVPWSEDLRDHQIMTLAKIACYTSHMDAVERFIQSGGEAGLILEDDVDMESDIHERLSGLWQTLPADWDMVWLGESLLVQRDPPPRRPRPAPRADAPNALHPSTHPLCTHAYALSRAGARRLRAHFRFPPFAYGRAFDQAAGWLAERGDRLRSYTVVPPLVVQAKVSLSDLDRGDDGLGSAWRDTLDDGVLARIWAAEARAAAEGEGAAFDDLG